MTAETVQVQQLGLFAPAASSEIERRLDCCRRLAGTWAGRIQSDEHRLEWARDFCQEVLRGFWGARFEDTPIRPSPIDEPVVASEERVSALEAGELAAELELEAAGFEVGLFYTSLLPKGFRSRLGVYYTPPALVKRLLDRVEEIGLDWSTCNVLDPACGGGAFLAPVAIRMIDRVPETGWGEVARRLSGFEIDAFGAWVTEVLLDAVALERLSVHRGAGTCVEVCDALEQNRSNEFSLVIGNPPYGRIRLPNATRRKFKRSLFGHANLYGVFTDQALRLCQEGGVVAMVTPTSFLGGEYFKALRRLLGLSAPPFSVDFVSLRKGVFDDVLQETSLATFRVGAELGAAHVGCLHTTAVGEARSEVVGTFSIPSDPSCPWVVPRTRDQSRLASRLSALSHTLEDYGYKVSTGPLVWNRHKRQLRADSSKGTFPIIWSEAVMTAGQFSFDYSKRAHSPYIELWKDQGWLLTKEACVLVQRTTAKEQSRRLIAAELPTDFLKRQGAVVVENHLNVLKPLRADPAVQTKVLAALLNSRPIDQVFRCLSGSVAVSAYELRSLPLPRPCDVLELYAEAGQADDFERAWETGLWDLYCAG